MIADIREALADMLTATGLRASGRLLAPGEINPPVLIVGGPTIDYNQTLRAATTRYNFEVTALLGQAVTRSAVEQLDALADNTGSMSVRRALEDYDPVAPIDTLQVMEFRPLTLEEIGQLNYYGGMWVVDVIVSEA